MPKWLYSMDAALLLTTLLSNAPSMAQGAARSCHTSATTFEGWKAEELSNEWIRVVIVPQLGGRVMQVRFGEHNYFFVNPKYKGKYIPPAEAAKTHSWINYGGDKLWPMPEGPAADRVALHFEDEQERDQGILGEAKVQLQRRKS